MAPKSITSTTSWDRASSSTTRTRPEAAAAASPSRSEIVLRQPSDSSLRVGILIEGRTFLVPAGEILLACVQDIVKAEFPVLGRFCWNDECGNCELSVKSKEALFAVRARGCQTVVEEGMELTELTPELSYFIRHKLR